jgi:hypothetical protein
MLDGSIAMHEGTAMTARVEKLTVDELCSETVKINMKLLFTLFFCAAERGWVDGWWL